MISGTVGNNPLLPGHFLVAQGLIARCRGAPDWEGAARRPALGEGHGRAFLRGIGFPQATIWCVDLCFFLLHVFVPCLMKKGNTLRAVPSDQLVEKTLHCS